MVDFICITRDKLSFISMHTYVLIYRWFGCFSFVYFSHSFSMEKIVTRTTVGSVVSFVLNAGHNLVIRFYFLFSPIDFIVQMTRCKIVAYHIWIIVVIVFLFILIKLRLDFIENELFCCVFLCDANATLLRCFVVVWKKCVCHR